VSTSRSPFMDDTPVSEKVAKRVYVCPMCGSDLVQDEEISFALACTGCERDDKPRKWRKAVAYYYGYPEMFEELGPMTEERFEDSWTRP